MDDLLPLSPMGMPTPRSGLRMDRGFLGDTRINILALLLGNVHNEIKTDVNFGSEFKWRDKMQSVMGQLSPQLTRGQRIKLRFGASNGFWRRAYQAALIEWRLDAHPKEFFVKSVDYQQDGQLVFEVEIKGSAEKLWTEKKIANLILGYNPKGFYLVFKNATVEFVQEKVVPAAKAIGEGLEYVAILVIAVLGLMVLKETKK